jgi:hypothetical protein
MRPVLFDRTSEESGAEWSGTFRVLPAKQVVHVKYLPAFGAALETFGLSGVEREIRNRIRAVLERDYDGVRIEFSESPPDNFVDYATIEVGGPDPNGLMTFGYDNSYNDTGKDHGNRYLADYLGGVNRRSEEAGFAAYGGVFIESFNSFSPTLYPDSFGTSPEFDRTLRDFMPALGGTPVAATEWPDGPRRDSIQQAILMLGNLAGHTASHEIGHSLGLAYFPQEEAGADERFHNDPPGDRHIMDSGSGRSFEERAEIMGAGPSRFSDENHAYLRRILPIR